MRSLRAYAVAVVAAPLALGFAGCAAVKAARAAVPSAPGDIAQLNVVTAPVGLDLDNIPGPDGFSVKVFANDEKHPKPVPIRTGKLEILMFNGTFFGRTNVPPALKIWSFDASELSSYQFSAGIGIGYEFVLRWGTNRPTQRLITVGARYTSPNQEIITSLPSSVTVLDPPH
jgi:hypothetical protein